MKLNANLYNLTQITQGKLFQALRKRQPQVAERLKTLPPIFQLRGGYAESPGWFMIQAAEFDPSPLTVSNLRVRDIYASERIVQGLLELLTGERWLAREGDQYSLTSSGREIIAQLKRRGAAYLTVEALDWEKEKVERLTRLMGDLIDLSLNIGPDPNPWSLVHSRNRAPQADAPLLQQLSQYFSDFNAYRDDAHMAAWKPLNIEGYVWEGFALIANGAATDSRSLYSSLFFRGYSQGEYQQALDRLTQRGWLGKNDVQYELTDAGKAVFEKVEAETDRFFYAPWNLLPPADMTEAVELLEALHAYLDEVIN
ncbi:MAG: hypothetical protein AAF633_01805 [Chloroflexota bacterium]